MPAGMMTLQAPLHLYYYVHGNCACSFLVARRDQRYLCCVQTDLEEIIAWLLSDESCSSKKPTKRSASSEQRRTEPAQSAASKVARVPWGKGTAGRSQYMYAERSQVTIPLQQYPDN